MFLSLSQTGRWRLTWRCCLAAAYWCIGATAEAQRIQFPTPIGPDSPFYSPPPNYGGPAGGAGGSPAPLGPFDPYATPSAPPNAPLYPQGGYIRPNGTAAAGMQSQRVLRELRIEDTWLAGSNKQDAMGMNDLDLSASFNLPFFWNPQPLIITPGFAFHFWNGPKTDSVPGMPDLPPVVYDAYLDAAWQPQINNFLSADLNVRVGVYTDFQNVVTDSIRITGRGMGVMNFSPNFKVALGVAYLARQNVKLIPAGGIIWTPNPDTRFDVVFPNPKISHRFSSVGNADWWWYVAGRYGGGRWTIERLGGANDRVTYNDMRIAGGVEFVTIRGWRGWFDVAYVFDREVLYDSVSPDYTPDDTVAVSAGFAF